MAGLVHWLMLRRNDWVDGDDGDGTAERYVTVGDAFLALLNEVDRLAAPFKEAKTLLDHMDDEVATDEDEEEEKVPPEGQAKPYRWGSKARQIKDFEEIYGKSTQGGKPKFEGHQYDITKMSRSERASHAFDDKDPWADIPIKELKAGNISLR
ncbi:hypothetical protein B0A48_04013 [Cryoendolithus antarcticus]|uniref:Uncharacterized protein n=1 Tax=Cryoendolithus antarcticus TaxID=1507870 RepID=A0A1V8TH44_9PEZI|nr:hypothetical protein B0A48_04013 [Cryoendolithus antarcticus]